MGLRLRDLGSDRFRWSDLRDFITHLPRDSALNRVRLGDAADWSVTDYLLANVVDAVNWLAWTKTKAAEKGRGRPKPVPRPGQQKPKNRDVQLMTVAEMKEYLARPRRPRTG